MSTDSELLELAAKAAGVGRSVGGDLWSDARGALWNPLTDDGDALRLAVATGVMRGRGFGNCWTAMYAVGKLPRDKFEATRRAIVMAAAEIGKTQ